MKSIISKTVHVVSNTLQDCKGIEISIQHHNFLALSANGFPGRLSSPILDSPRKLFAKKLIISNPFEAEGPWQNITVINSKLTMEKVHNVITVRGIPLNFNCA